MWLAEESETSRGIYYKKIVGAISLDGTPGTTNIMTGGIILEEIWLNTEVSTWDFGNKCFLPDDGGVDLLELGTTSPKLDEEFPPVLLVRRKALDHLLL